MDDVGEVAGELGPAQQRLAAEIGVGGGAVRGDAGEQQRARTGAARRLDRSCSHAVLRARVLALWRRDYTSDVKRRLTRGYAALAAIPADSSAKRANGRQSAGSSRE